MTASPTATWQAEYVIPGSGGGNEYGKPSGFMTGPDGKPIKKVLAPPALRAAWVAPDKSTLLLALDFDPVLHRDFGAPEVSRGVQLWSLWKL